MNATLTIPPCPRLAGDRGRSLEAGPVVERQLAWALLHTMRAAFPDTPMVIDYGDEKEPVVDMEQGMEAIFAVDESLVRCGKAWVLVICGNDECFISDYVMRPGVEEAVHAAERHVGIRA
jgi:hypothetical protein